jgi:hypothetical protein
MQLFNISKESLSPLVPVKFGIDHFEKKIQKWADAHPDMLNEGKPMLSIGCEMNTTLGHAIDNLFIDGNGTLVVCEAKRGKAPREVISQLLDYAAFVDGLSWDDLEKYCQKRHKKTIDAACQEVFGRVFPKDAKLSHRLMVLAENFDEQIMKQALYLIGVGTPLILIQFSYFHAGEAEILQIETALGQIPEQASKTSITKTAMRDTQGADTWLFSTVGAALPDIAVKQGWDLSYKVNKQSLPFHLAGWPHPLGDCQLRIDSFKTGTLAFRFSFRKQFLPGLERHLLDSRDQWHSGFPAELEQPPYETAFTCFSYELPFPAVGDGAAMNDIISKVESMGTALIPVIELYFEGKK